MPQGPGGHTAMRGAQETISGPGASRRPEWIKHKPGRTPVLPEGKAVSVLNAGHQVGSRGTDHPDIRLKPDDIKLKRVL